MKNRMVYLSVLVLSAILFASCGGQAAEAAPAEVAETAEEAVVEETAAEDLTIGALWLDASEFYTMVEAGINQAVADSGMEIKVLASNSKGDSAVEADQMQTLIGADVDAIIMSAVSEDASVEFVKQAHEAGIPVICYNSCISMADAEKYVYTWVTGDQHQQGSMVATALGKYLLEQGFTAPKIAVVNCEQYAVCQQRIAGFTETLKSLVPDAVIVDNQEAIEVDKAAEVTTNMLTANPDVVAIYGEAGNMCAGATVAIEQANLVGKVVVFGHDISPVTADLLLDGSVLKYINAMIGEDFGKESVKFALAAINGEASPGVIYNMTPAEFYSTEPDAVQTWLDAHK
jgi:ABC-type sugar transport system substrate-binding protein